MFGFKAIYILYCFYIIKLLRKWKNMKNLIKNYNKLKYKFKNYKHRLNNKKNNKLKNNLL